MFQSLCSVVAGVSAAKETVPGYEEDYVTHNWLFFIVVVKMWTHVSEWHYFSYLFDTVEVLGIETMGKFCFVCHTNPVS